MRNFIIVLSAISFFVSCSISSERKVKIGNYYADVLHGITFMYDNNQAFLFRIGYLDSTNTYIATYNEHLKTLKDGSGQKFYGSSPDYSYNKYGFTTDKENLIWIEWSVLETGNVAVGKIFSDNPQEIFVEVMQTWPDLPGVYYTFKKNGFTGKLERMAQHGNWHFDVLNVEPLENFFSIDGVQSLHDKISNNDVDQYTSETFFPSGAISYSISKDKPLYFVSGEKSINISPEKIDQQLNSKQTEYTTSRFAIESPFGEIWEAVSNHLNQSRVFGTQSKLSANVVSRGWCKEYNQQLYEWDSFFQAMLASIEDPEGGKETVRSILFHQTKEGIVPNVALGNDTLQNSFDRSQPPVGAICVWKMHQYHPDIEFLKEVYPKLLKWHNWWFDIRPENGLPYRDGNRNGLLEWGTEIGTWLQGAKYESGQDNSPMFDDARMNEFSRTMELDMAGLSGLWAADALYLSFIARELGKMEDASLLEQQVKDMNQRINDLLWNEEIGMYCNRYWDEYSRKPSVKIFKSIPATAVIGEIDYEYQDKNGDKTKKKVNRVELSNNEAEDLSQNNATVTWNFILKPEISGAYFFYTPEELGVHLTIDEQTIIDNRQFWITEFISDPLNLESGKEYQVTLNYSGDMGFELLWTTEQKTEGSLFSERLGPTLFYPLISNAPDEAKGKRIIANLVDTTLFWGNHVIPTIARNDPAFPSQGYWRGRIWPPTNYLGYLGINNYASDEITWQYAVKSAQQAQNEWIKRGHLYENYYANGPGAGDPHYCWGGLMQLILLEELAGIDGNGNIVTNPFCTPDYKIKNFPNSEKRLLSKNK